MLNKRSYRDSCQLVVVQTLVQNEGEQTAAAGKIALPELMAFAAGQRGMVDRATCGCCASHSAIFRLLS
jgi:hypothetical protein